MQTRTEFVRGTDVQILTEIGAMEDAGWRVRRAVAASWDRHESVRYVTSYLVTYERDV